MDWALHDHIDQPQRPPSCNLTVNVTVRDEGFSFIDTADKYSRRVHPSLIAHHPSPFTPFTGLWVKRSRPILPIAPLIERGESVLFR
jgi:hypothetical protein